MKPSFFLCAVYLFITSNLVFAQNDILDKAGAEMSSSKPQADLRVKTPDGEWVVIEHRSGHFLNRFRLG